jgi:hypothetical protein
MASITEEDPEFQTVRSLLDLAEDLSTAALRARRAAYSALRAYDALGRVDRPALAKALGVSRQRVWQMLNDEAVTTGEFDAVLIDLAESAWLAWDEGGRSGDPEDFFDVNAVVRPEHARS